MGWGVARLAAACGVVLVLTGPGCRRLTARAAQGLLQPPSTPSGSLPPSLDRLARQLPDLPPARRQVVAAALDLVGDVDPDLDCSALAQRAYAAAGIGLPRTVREQLRCGQRVAETDLLPGDLVFFAFERRPADHVGVYAGDGCLVHVSSAARQVQVVGLDAAGFARARAGARRLLPAPEAPGGFDPGTAGSR